MVLSNEIIVSPPSYYMFYVCVTVSPPLKHVDMVVDFDELKMILAGMFLHAGHSIYAGQYNLGKKMSFSSSIELKMFCFYLKHLRFFFLHNFSCLY